MRQMGFLDKVLRMPKYAVRQEEEKYLVCRINDGNYQPLRNTDFNSRLLDYLVDYLQTEGLPEEGMNFDIPKPGKRAGKFGQSFANIVGWRYDDIRAGYLRLSLENGSVEARGNFSGLRVRPGD